MAVGRRFEEALQKALRMVNENANGLDPGDIDVTEEVDLVMLLAITNCSVSNILFVVALCMVSFEIAGTH